MIDLLMGGQAEGVLLPLGVALIVAAIILLAWHRIHTRRAKSALRTTLIRYKVWDWLTGITGSRQKRLTYRQESESGAD